MPAALKKALVILLLLPLLAVGVLLPLVTTERGTRLLLEQARRWSGDSLTWEQLQGPLTGPLHLQGASFRRGELLVEADTMALDWQPLALLRGRLQVNQLQAAGIRIEIPETEEAPPPTEPLQLSDLHSPLDVGLRDVRITDLQLRLDDQPARVIDLVAIAANLESDRLQLEQARIDTPEGGLQVKGSAGGGEELPLDLELEWNWQLPGGHPVGGQLLATGNARALTLRHRGSGELPVNLEGEIQNLLEHPAWQLELRWPELDLAAAGVPLLLGPGGIQSEGTLEDYHLSSAGELRGEGLDPTSWSLQARGDAGSLRLSPLTLSAREVVLELGGTLDWRGPITVDLHYRAGADRLVEFHPDLPPRLDAEGNLRGSFQDQTVTLDSLDLALEQAPLRLDLHGELQLPAGADPMFNGTLHWTGLQWPLAAGEPGVASTEGTLELSGTPDAYAIDLAAAMAGTQVPAGEWRGHATGNREGLLLDSLRGELLGGELGMSGPLGWVPEPSWTLRLEGKGLDPGQWLPELPGQLELALHTTGHVSARDGPSARLELERLSGRLAEHDLSLSARARLAGEDLQLEDLQLASGGNRFTAAGRLSPGALGVDWQLQATAPGALIAGARGRLTAAGRLEGSTAQPRLQARLRGDALGMDALSLSRLAADIEAGLAPDDLLRLDVQLDAVEQEGQTLLEATHLLASGTTARHSLELDLQGVGEHLRLRLEGGLEPSLPAWRGRLTALDAESERAGDWRLAGAGELALSATSLQLDEICLQPVAVSGRICAQGDWGESTGTNVTGRLEQLPVERFLPGISGELSGELEAGLDVAGALRVRAGLDASPGQIRVNREQGAVELDYGGGHLGLTVGPGGLAGTLHFAAPAQGEVQAALQLPAIDRLPLAAHQPLSGEIHARLPDLSGLPALIPELAASAGRLEADLRLAGSLEQPLILGNLALSDGAADIPLAGLQLREIQLDASDDPACRGCLVLKGGLVSGSGQLALNGRVDLSGEQLELNLRGDRVQVYNTPDATALASPDLQISWHDEVLTLRGRLTIPEAAITPKLGLSPGLVAEEGTVAPAPGQLIAPSPDVVVLGAEGEPPRGPELVSPVRLDSQLELRLGDRVRIDAIGFKSGVTGAVTFTNHPWQTDLIPVAKGQLSLENGTFRAFGQDLEITKGQLIFPGGPVTEPEVAVQAVRWIDNDPEVTAAGVLVSGSVTEPTLELFTRPFQRDPSDVQSYLLTGSTTSNKDTVLSIGTYLHPRLYVGYGYNLLWNTSEFNSLFTITPRWGMGATVGEADNNVNLTFTYER